MQEKLQWHPGFFAAIQIEFESESYMLTFENEHSLGTKPREIDVLIIKKDSTAKLRKKSMAQFAANESSCAGR